MCKPTIKQQIYVVAGWLSFALGFIGMFLPLLPTTVFWIAAAWLWLRGNPVLAQKVFAHPRFGQPIQAFLEHGVLSAKGKTYAVLGMTGSYLVFWWLVQPTWLLASMVGGTLLVVAAWLLSRPQPETLAAMKFA